MTGYSSDTITKEEYRALMRWQSRNRRLLAIMMLAVVFISLLGAAGTLPGTNQNLSAMLLVATLFMIALIQLLAGLCPRCNCRLFMHRGQGLMVPDRCPECRASFRPQA
jgi:formate hydrogenlyase subunit 4